MRKIFPALLAATLLAGCTKEQKTADNAVKPEKTPVQKTNIIPIKEGLELDTFAFPQDIQGCSCYFAKNKEDFNNQKYIYADDYGNNAQVRISGQLVKFPMKEGDFDPSNFSKTLDNGEYKLEITGKKINDSEEEMIFEGQITVTDKNGKKYTSTLYGECGC